MTAIGMSVRQVNIAVLSSSQGAPRECKRVRTQRGRYLVQPSYKPLKGVNNSRTRPVEHLGTVYDRYTAVANGRKVVPPRLESEKLRRGERFFKIKATGTDDQRLWQARQ